MLYVLGEHFRRWRTERCESHRSHSRELSAARTDCELYIELICGCKYRLRIDGGISLITWKCCRCPPLIRSQMFHSSWFSHWQFLSLFLLASRQAQARRTAVSCACSRCLFAAALADSNRGYSVHALNLPPPPNRVLKSSETHRCTAHLG